jgi:predicted metal-dependent phosphoesterase TrpH
MHRDGSATREARVVFCDLHLHSDCSDGTTPPAQVVRLAAAARMRSIALTDHDTLDGVPEAIEEGRRVGVHVVPGVELSLDHERGTFHMIGLGVDLDNPDLLAGIARIRGARDGRNDGVLQRLAELGVPVSAEELAEEAGDAVVGRPHLATVMLRRGYVVSVQDAFDRYLGRGAPAYVERDRMTLAEAVAAVHGAGGATVLCHPHTLGFDPGVASRRAELVSFLRQCATAGLDAMEVRCGSFTRAAEKVWESVCRDAGLLRSGGSDFHGDRKPGLRVGVGRGRMRVPHEWLDALLLRAAAR